MWGCRGGSTYGTLINVMHHINRLKDKTHMIISLDSDNAFDKIHYPFMIKFLERLETQGAYLNIINTIYYKPTENMNVHWKKI